MKGYFRKRGAKWSFSIDIGTDPLTGKRKQKTMSGFATKKEAQMAASNIQQELLYGSYVNEKDMLYADLANDWMKSYAASVKPSTLRIRRHEMGKLVLYLGKMRVKSITRMHYRNFLADMHRSGLSTNTISGIHITANMIFKHGIDIEVIKTNPAQYVKPPKEIKSVDDIEVEDAVIKYLERKELIVFLETARQSGLERDYELFYTLSYTGMRVGELCALKWSDIDFNNHTISITKTYYNPSNRATEFQLLTPKTQSARRIIDVDPSVTTLLSNFRIEQMKILNFENSSYNGNFVFAKIGKYAGYPELIKTVELRMSRLLKLSGISKSLTPHSLRHTHTSLLAEAGVGIHEIMDRLGHQDDKITREVYLHITDTMKKVASDKFSKLMNTDSVKEDLVHYLTHRKCS